MNKKEQKISIDDETHKKLKKKSEELGMSVSEIVRKSTEYVENNNIDICEDLRERDDLLIGLRPRLLKKFGTLAEASRQLMVTPSTISRYFSGKSKPSKSMVSKLLKVLD